MPNDPNLPALKPESFDTAAPARLLESAEALRAITACVSPQVGAALDFARAAPAGPEVVAAVEPAGAVVRLVPWKSGEGKSPVVVAALTRPVPQPAEPFADQLRSVLAACWAGQVASGRLSPAILLLLYGGRDPWRLDLDPERIADLPAEQTALDPKFKVVFLSVRTADAQVLDGRGPFGRLLRAWAADRGRARDFVDAYEGVLDALDRLPTGEAADADFRLCLWFLIHLMVFRREVGEFPRLRQGLLGYFQDARRRREAENMLRTIFDSCSEIGEIKARREVLLDLMTTKFGALPDEDVAKINRMQKVSVLTNLTRRVLIARDLDDMGLWDSMMGGE
jgi:hypothetical protein